MNSFSNLKHIGLISDSSNLKFSELMSVGAALQKQILRDLSPIWGIQATVDVFASLDDLPSDYWPIIIRDDIKDPSAAGIHSDDNGHPFALVQYSDGWSLTASHECLEMLCDPDGNRIIAGPSPMPSQGRVNFLVEICDPSEGDQFAYTVNGVLVSDFYTPNYFDPIKTVGVRYSFSGAIKRPRDVLKDGYLSWHDPISDHWFQQVYFGPNLEFRDIGPLSHSEGSIRALIYDKTPEAFVARTPNAKRFLAASKSLSHVAASGSAKARRLRDKILRIVGDA